MGDRPDDDIIPLADLTLTCSSCGRSFIPVSGEQTCKSCIHVAVPGEAAVVLMQDHDAECPKCGHSLRGLRQGSACPECGFGATPRPSPWLKHQSSTVTSPSGSQSVLSPFSKRRRRPPPADDLVRRGTAASIAVLTLLVAALLFAIVGGLLAITHWWTPSLLDHWSIILGWGAYSLTAISLCMPGSLPARRCPRWLTTMAVAGGCFATGIFALYPLTSGVGGIALRSLWDLLAIVATLSFVIGLVGRMNAITEFAGQDPDERGFLSSAGPTLLGIFIISSGFLMTWFFRRKLDFADAFAIAVFAWLVWRLVALLGHVNAAMVARVENRSRELRARQLGPVGDGVDLVGPVCANCGHALRGIPSHARCPECGGHDRA
ncbi:MAG: hypothetical protein JNL80_18855 [Phycisphaerae bacterium]|jgi:hypothetical protein|nr:hypothetical protein [Phycisphaerae bacterium]